MNPDEQWTAAALRALSNDARLDIMRWLKDPTAHFTPQSVGSFEVEGVCASTIQERLGLAQPTVSAHLRTLHQAGLVVRTKVGAWQFYKRDEQAVRRLLDTLAAEL
ncbi:ArsR family transcriptional regulator [Streptosporangium becharense]|uniref:ArsR family transcriptional regulator n=1 Tax=Streptosporangium becharense TaxID=1816182 RepID=A0A7W9IAM8_9ACTN|nr:metalloregulator ArsR/SmtB family transcription factor [Streptosporangium becharense]MBB2914205.1 ArsR family transcriptional regulator [Streptosporangium becharense]MBB5817232.1 ArsR family transcriptional regulator [Streptosporangium becharense]